MEPKKRTMGDHLPDVMREEPDTPSKSDENA